VDHNESSGGPADVISDHAASDERSPAVLALMRLFRSLERVDAGLTPQQYRILKLAGAGGERSARLAERLAVAKPTLTAIADGLVAAGYARRETEPGDRRVVRLCLTPAGREAVERADAAYAGWQDRLLGGVSEADRIAILRSLSLLDAALDELRCAHHTAAAAGTAGPEAISQSGPLVPQPAGLAAE
jgi:DNA-binding MarR family transcriptional regulator